MLSLPEAWVWDFWTADDGDRTHLFFLYASRALQDPDRRHYRAAIGHAVSDDLVEWERLPDALVHGDAPAFDDLATWTGSVVRHDDGGWFLFYTGATLTPAGNVQSIGYATSDDLVTWEKAGTTPVAAADPRWYERLADGQWHDEAFRDPWVLRDPDGDGWHMLVTARANHGAADDRGVVGHAVSADLRTWEVREPLTAPGAGFGQLEVLQTVEIEGRWFLVFNCFASDMSADARATGTEGGVWAAPSAGPLGPYDIASAQLLSGRSHYVGKILTDRDGATVYLAFLHDAADGTFIGAVDDPRPVRLDGDRLIVEGLTAEVPAGV